MNAWARPRRRPPASADAGDREQPRWRIAPTVCPAERAWMRGTVAASTARSAYSEICWWVSNRTSSSACGGINVYRAVLEFNAGDGCAVSTCRSWRKHDDDRSKRRDFASHDGGATMHGASRRRPASGVTRSTAGSARSPRKAMALYHGETFDLRLTPAFCDRILGVRRWTESPSIRCCTRIRCGTCSTTSPRVPDLSRGFDQTADPTGVLSTAATRSRPRPRPGRRGDPRDAAGLARLVERRVVGSVRRQMASFAAGFGAVIPTLLCATHCAGC